MARIPLSNRAFISVCVGGDMYIKEKHVKHDLLCRTIAYTLACKNLGVFFILFLKSLIKVTFIYVKIQ